MASPRRRWRSTISHSVKAAACRWKVPAVQRGRAGPRGRGRLGEVPFEHVDIHLDGFEIDGNGVAADQEHRCANVGQRLAERRERLSEALAGLGLRRIAPQEAASPSRSQAPRGESARCESTAMAFFGASRGLPVERRPETPPRVLGGAAPRSVPPGIAIRDYLLTLAHPS
jgi:hypothetical protein